ncbi:MAG: hypothetical protein MUO42_10005 [Anaerolineaceae bacterium]|jgi:hypothetical protein|nr:hypothetical protein [Anaerolineaceae bacterium]
MGEKAHFFLSISVTLWRCIQDHINQFGVVNTISSRFNDQVRYARRQARQRIDLQGAGLPVAIGFQTDF